MYCKTEIYYDLNNIFFFRLQLPQDIALNEVIGKGKSGCVRKGLLNEEIIAVKIFLPQSKQSWTLEKDIYACCGMTEHDNILKFLGEAERKDNMGSEYWLGENIFSLKMFRNQEICTRIGFWKWDKGELKKANLYFCKMFDLFDDFSN